MNIYEKRRNIKITEHARQRLRERLPEIPERDYQNIVNKARYEGISFDNSMVDDSTYLYLKHRFRFNNSTKLKIYKNALFVFCGGNGHARNLVTVVNIPKGIIKINEVN